MKKRIISLAAAMLLVFSMMTPFAGASYDNPRFTDAGMVTFDGKAMSDFGGTVTLNSNFQPGDDMKITITLNNSCDTASDWYMSNEVEKAFEDAAKTNNGSYTYRLDYFGPDGSRTIFSSDGIGGDSEVKLQEATSGLSGLGGEDFFFYLGKLPAYGTAAVTLYVAIDGETQNNSYFNTLAHVNMRFAVEKPGSRIIPKTSENGDMYIWGGATLGCAILAALLLITDRKRNGGAA